MTKKPTPAAERQRETTTELISALLLMVAENRPDTDPVVRRESALTWSGEPGRKTMTTRPRTNGQTRRRGHRPGCVDPRTTHPPISERIVRPQDHQNLQGLLEPDALKGARPVLRGARR